jgi:hypothetical protein
LQTPLRAQSADQRVSIASAATFNRLCRALTEAELQGIRTDVFNVSAPIAP